MGIKEPGWERIFRKITKDCRASAAKLLIDSIPFSCSQNLKGSVEKIALRCKWSICIKSSIGGFKLHYFYFQCFMMQVGHFILGQFRKFLSLPSHFSTGP